MSFTQDQIAQIKIALDCCTNFTSGGCDNCPYEDGLSKAFCMPMLLRNALELILFYEAENSELRNIKEQFQILDLECERLEKLDEEHRKVIDLLESRVTSLPDEIRAEAYEEFYRAVKRIPGAISHSELKEKYDQLLAKGFSPSDSF